jgi:hypothetical protein
MRERVALDATATIVSLRSPRGLLNSNTATAVVPAFQAIFVKALGYRSLEESGKRASRSRQCPQIRNPPSTGRVWPVMKEAAGEHSHTTALTTSSGSPTRPNGCIAVTRAVMASS